MTGSAISLAQVSKVYQTTGRDGSLKESLTHSLRRLWGAQPARVAAEFRALDDVSLEIREGEAFGLVGRNGAGKSTLLKILSKVTAPTSGAVSLRGRVGSLLEVGTGFHPELTGRENIYLAGGIQGMSGAEVRRRFDDIVAFSDVESFLDEPVKRYSSGMYLRLAFAVAAHMDPDILLVDEALAVGDIPFQRRCLARMREMLKHGRTVVLVSHNPRSIVHFCQRAAWLDRGRLVNVGEAPDVMAAYLQSVTVAGLVLRWEGDAGDELLRLRATCVEPEGMEGFVSHAPIRIGFEVELRSPIQDLVAAVELRTEEGVLLAYSAHDDALPPPAPLHAPGRFAWELSLPPNTLAAGTYEVVFDFGVHNQRRIIADAGNLRFEVRNPAGLGRRFPAEKWRGVLRPAWAWRRVEK